jgi:7,8-dihydropterin-6-yl-methyl-4-(beta-D-ribofuranosyl)aminobenzene 5'-phosphate synthase
MKLTVLVDNNTFINQYLIGEPAVSYYIEMDNQNILFDAGYSDAFLINAQRLDIDLTHLDKVVLSHGHLDHTWGLQYLVRLLCEKSISSARMKKPILIAHPEVFQSRTYKNDPEIGSLLKEETLGRFFELQLSREPLELTSKLLFLGQVERLNDFESQHNIGMVRQKNGDEIPDMVMDDSALVYKAERGLVIITGCSHAGICNIIEYAKKVTGESRILDIIGGLHLLNPSQKQIQGSLDYFAKNKPFELHACYCTDLPSKKG